MKTLFSLINKTVARIVCVGAAMIVGHAARANYVQNPDFGGYGGFSENDWTLSGDTSYNSGTSSDGLTAPLNTAWSDGAVGAIGYLSQNLNGLTTGQDYTITFWIHPEEDYGFDYVVGWGGSEVFGVGDPNYGYASSFGTWTDLTNGSHTSLNVGSWNEIEIDPFAGGPIVELDFGIQQDPGYTQITGVDVENGSQNVPDQGLGMAVSGAALIGLCALSALRSRRRLA
jgi:hypothetical protein